MESWLTRLSRCLRAGEPACFADVVNRDDVRMIQCRRRARFANQTLTAVRSVARGGKNFNCDFALEFEIGGR